MPTNYSGNPNNITTPLSAGIISCTSGAGGLVLVGTSAAHGFATYDTVTVSGVTGTTEANTTAEIQVISSTSFLMDGVTFVNSYSSGGTAEDLSLTPYFQMPDDGEAGTVQSIEAAIQNLADRTQFLKGIIPDLVSQSFSTSDSLVVPAGVTKMIGVGWGAGGGGGAGSGTTGTNNYGSGGGGGGAAVQSVQTFDVTPGDALDITIGYGGIGGVAGGADAGQDGSYTEVQDSFPNILASWPGGQGGRLGGVAIGGTTYNWGVGGSTVSTAATVFDSEETTIKDLYREDSPGHGGAGTTKNNTFKHAGNPSATGKRYDGGGNGADGSDSGSYRGGGGGGGGGAGPGGAGSIGGDGGGGNSGGAGFAGGNANAGVPANSGAGGGGGGSAGAGTSAGSGGTGDTGGRGFLTLFWVK